MLEDIFTTFLYRDVKVPICVIYFIFFPFCLQNVKIKPLREWKNLRNVCF